MLQSMLWPHNFSSAYFARHWACAIDVIELVATLGDCSLPEIAGDDMRWDKVALGAMHLLLPFVNNAVLSLTGAAGRLTLRQAWGLTLRSERALREVAPHWSKLEAGGRSSAPLCTCLGATSLLASLVHEKPLEAWKAEDTSALLLQLLTSNTASLLKLCWHSGRSEGVVMNKGLIFLHDIALRCSDLGPACSHAVMVAGPAIFFLLAPRHIAYALHAAPSWSANRASGCCHPRLVDAISVSFWLHWMVTPCCSLIPNPRLSLLALTAQPMTALLRLVMDEVNQSPEWVTPKQYDGVITALSSYAEIVVSRVHLLASHGCEEAPVGSAQLRDLLAQPVLYLLGSPLLDRMTMLQHAPTTLTWVAQYHPRLIPPLNRPDDVEIAGCQVGNIYSCHPPFDHAIRMCMWQLHFYVFSLSLPPCPAPSLLTIYC